MLYYSLDSKVFCNLQRALESFFMGKKLLIALTLLVLSLVVGQTPVTAQNRMAGASASLASQSEVTQEQLSNYRSNMEYVKAYNAIRKVLKKRNSPLVDSTPAFIKSCIDHNLDCYLLPSIAGLESSFGQALLPGSNNPFGWGGGYILFKDWEEGIDTVAAGLNKNYVSRGAVTVEQIGVKYSESPTWAPRVRAFMEQFRRAESEGLNSSEIGLEL